MLNYLITILNLKASTETEAKDLSIQMLVVMDFIKSKFGSLTIPEIQEAFKMYLAKEFPGVKVFRILDCVVVGEVLNAFKEFRNESLRVYDRKKLLLIAESKQMSEEEIKSNREELLKFIFQDIQEKQISDDAWMLYENLEYKINATAEERKKLYSANIKIYLMEFKNHKQARESLTAKFAIEELQDKIKKGEVIQSVANKCKSILVSKYLINYKNYDEFKNAIQL